MDKKIFFHINTQDLSPIDMEFDSIANIGNYEDNVLVEISIQDLLDYLDQDEMKEYLNIIISKLKPGGKLYIQGSDIKQLGMAIVFNRVDLSLIQRVLYPNKKSIHTISEVLAALNGDNISIENKQFINIFEYYICVKKNS